MELALDDNLLRELVRTVSPGADIQARDVLSDWQLSRVERVHLEDGSSIIIKRSRSPLTAEGRVLQSLRTTDIPLADLYLADEHEDTLTLLIEDLGPSRRQPSVTEAAAAAVRAHAAPPPDGLPVMDQEALQSLPRTIAAGIESLDSSGRWRRTDRLRGLLETISGLAPELSQSASMPPFGLCHSEFHPTSLHVGEAKTALVDWARAYVGPGLLDLASWFQMGATPPDAADSGRACWTSRRGSRWARRPLTPPTVAL